MLTPDNTPDELARVAAALGRNEAPGKLPAGLPIPRGRRVCSVREAVFAPHETVPVSEALGRVCGAPTVACPPAIPIAVSGEEITPQAIALLRHYGIADIDVLV